MKSHLQAAFERWLERTDLPKREIEYQFRPERQRRFDFAWPNHSFAVEIEDIGPFGDRYQRLADAEKYEATLMLRPTVYRVPGRGKRRHRDTWGRTT